VHPQRVVQLDYSEVMLNLKEREPALLKMHADACAIPLAAEQFGAVVGFLVDPFLGLQSLHEAFRMLVPGGRLFLTTPTAIWGTTLRRGLVIDERATRFKKVDGESKVVLPSLLHPPERIHEMLAIAGFIEVEVLDHGLATGETTISPDISAVAKELKRDVSAIPIIHSIRATRPQAAPER
jgi:SAM-dependent methyltransferase